MKRILFVDDETMILDGLRRMLRGMRKEWDMHFVQSGEEALTALAKDDFDVLVSDIRMPGMDGSELCSAVRKSHPRIVRIILSGHAELELAMRSANCAHQFLTKPCDPDNLKSVVTRSFALHERLDDDELKGTVGNLRSLPVLPSTYRELNDAISDEEVTLEAVADIVARDVGITAKILQLVNSSFFGLPREVGTVKDAVSYIGLSNLKTLVLRYGMMKEFDAATSAPSFDLAAEQRHSLRVATLASRMHGDDRRASDEAFLAGMLHDIGSLVIATNLPDVFERVSRASRLSKQPLHTLEMRALGVTHADVGAYLLGIWGMPYSIVEAAHLHHTPSELGEHASFDCVASVHIADALARELERPNTPSSLDQDFVRGLGLEDRLEEWRADAADVGASESQAA